MCVIAIVDDTLYRPSEEEIRAMWAYSDDGGGVAWREDFEGSPIVKWRKGLELRTMIDLIATLPVPFVAHFRLTSAGTNIPALNHPFPVTPEALPQMEGSTGGSVLFHNGTWTSWEEKCRAWILATGGQIKSPSGPWSDSRAMAFWAYHLGSVIFEENSFWKINEKVVLFSPTQIEVFNPDGWSLWNGYTVSNEIWVNRLPKPKAESKLITPSEALQAAQNYFTTPPKSLPAGEPKEGSPTLHPFERARQEYETASLAYHTIIDGKRQGSKKQMNKKRNRFEGVQRKYPALRDLYLQEIAEADRRRVTRMAEAKIAEATNYASQWLHHKAGERLH